MPVQLLTVLVLSAVLFGTDAINRPAYLGRPRGEHPGNLTIDQAILSTVDPNAPSSYSLPGGPVLAELDMWLTAEQNAALYEKGKGPNKRNAIRDEKLRWTKKTIPYMFYNSHFTLEQQYWIRRAMTDYERWTCINFRPATKTDVNWVRFQNGEGCNSQLGMFGGMQELNLETPGCRWKGLYLHEIGHAIGLVHEHQRPDRDDWITVNYNNVEPDMRQWFQKYSTQEVDNMGVEYEYASIMHYGITAFSPKGLQTIFAKYKNREEEIGTVYLKELAYSDVAIVNKMYKCAAHCPNQDKCGADGVLDENCRCICKDGSHDTCDKTKKADPSCTNRDASWKCYIWATQGECERSPDYMLQGCRKACQLCGKKAPSPSSPCRNQYLDKKCNMWAKRGDCMNNKRWMTENCPVACKFCTPQDRNVQESCTDKADSKKCSDWKYDGECVINPRGMFWHCKKSCLGCNNTDGHIGFGETEIADMTDLDAITYKCVDKDKSCSAWAAGNQCDMNPAYMLDNCRRACGKCLDGSCKNLWSDAECYKWAQEGECTNRVTWMSKNCAQSCSVGKCVGKPTIVPTKMTRPPRQTDAPLCRNTHNDKDCEIWAHAGHCETNPGYMRNHCAGSCRVCSSKDDKTTTPKPHPDCQDKHHSCPGWKRAGMCETGAMALKLCPYSCDNCGCVDETESCSSWAKSGQCMSNFNYMLRSCQKACGAC